MKQRKLSGLIPMYQAEKYIEEAIRSVSLQRVSGLELIIMDDGSSDRSAEDTVKNANALKQFRSRRKGSGQE